MKVGLGNITINVKFPNLYNYSCFQEIYTKMFGGKGACMMTQNLLSNILGKKWENNKTNETRYKQLTIKEHNYRESGEM